MTSLAYPDFLASKRIRVEPAGFDATEPLNPSLFPFQRDITRWALRRGRAAIFAGTGLGKTLMQLEWARHVHAHCGRPILILAPLAVSKQTAREGAKFGIDVKICETQRDATDGINITNYEKLHHFDPASYQGIIIDESSILKSWDGKTRKQLTEFAQSIPFRLACTATPAPNDLIELTNHAEFLNIMTGKEIIALFFTQDGNSAQKFRLKGHARRDFWKWMASWSVAIRSPADLGYPDGDFVLPPLQMHHSIIESQALPGYLIPMEAVGLAEQRAARRQSLDERVSRCAELVNANDEPWIVWCDLNDESAALADAIPGAVEIQGSDSNEHKESSMLGFSAGKIRVLVTKPTIAGFGMNWQHCHNVAFVGVTHSFEQYYQAIRRCWRFGQTQPVDCHVFTSESEGAVLDNLRRKETEAAGMMDNIVTEMKGLSLGKSGRDEMDYSPSVKMTVPDWLRGVA